MTAGARRRDSGSGGTWDGAEGHPSAQREVPVPPHMHQASLFSFPPPPLGAASKGTRAIWYKTRGGISWGHTSRVPVSGAVRGY